MKNLSRHPLLLALLASLLFASIQAPSAFAYLENSKIPVCLDGKTEIQVDNEQILKWKTSTRNQFLARGYAAGKVQGKPWMKGEHVHFIMTLGPGPKDTLEVIYNTNFGEFPQVNEGDSLVVCGDYITSIAQSGRYEPSPVGAIIHWIHYNPANRPSSADHEHGFIAFGSTLVGFDDAPVEAWDGEIVRATHPDRDNDRKHRDEKKDNDQYKRRTTRPQPEMNAPTPPARGRVDSSTRERARSSGRGRSARRNDEPRVENLPEICRHVRGRCQ